MTTITLYIFDNLNPINQLEAVTVRLYNQAGDSFITQLITGSDGIVTTDVPDGTYWVRFYKKGYSFDSKLLIEVDQNLTNEWIITGEDLTELPPSRADGICRVSGYVIDAQGSPTTECIVTFMMPKSSRVMGRNIIATEKVVAQADKNGYFEIELIQNVVYGAYMHSIIDDVVMVKVPNLQSCSITDLIYPEGKLLQPLPASATITVGTESTLSVNLGSSSGIDIPDTDIGLTVKKLFKIESSDKKSLSVSIKNKEEILLEAKSSGSYTVTLYSKCIGDFSVEGDKVIGTISVTANE